jgi:release factor glutamine methyltransferase
MNFKKATIYIQDQLSNIYSQREAQSIADLVLEEITQFSKTERIINFEQELSSHQIHQLENYLDQLKLHKPLQQVLGYAWFFGNKFNVNEHVLIPRPETEELVELIVNENTNKTIKILDVGTGSGCIAISLKKKIPYSTVTAIDISAFALQVAHQNATNLHQTIQLKQLNFLNEETWAELEQFDIIVSNPPYIKQSEQDSMQNNVLLYEPHVALFVPDNDALIFYNKIAFFAKKHLNKNGNIYVEINESLGIETAEVFINKGFHTSIIKDMLGKDRLIKAWR